MDNNKEVRETRIIERERGDGAIWAVVVVVLVLVILTLLFFIFPEIRGERVEEREQFNIEIQPPEIEINRDQEQE